MIKEEIKTQIETVKAKKEIKLRIHDETDLFSSFDPDRKLLSEEVLTYLERNYMNKHRMPLEEYVLHIYSDEPMDEESVKDKLHDYFKQGKENIQFGIRRLTMKEVYLFAVGVFFLMLWFLLAVQKEVVGPVRAEILSITGWVAIWEAAGIFIMERPEMIALKKNYERFSRSEIIIDVIGE